MSMRCGILLLLTLSLPQSLAGQDELRDALRRAGAAEDLSVRPKGSASFLEGSAALLGRLRVVYDADGAAYFFFQHDEALTHPLAAPGDSVHLLNLETEARHVARVRRIRAVRGPARLDGWKYSGWAYELDLPINTLLPVNEEGDPLVLPESIIFLPYPLPTSTEARIPDDVLRRLQESHRSQLDRQYEKYSRIHARLLREVPESLGYLREGIYGDEAHRTLSQGEVRVVRTPLGLRFLVGYASYDPLEMGGAGDPYTAVHDAAGAWVEEFDGDVSSALVVDLDEDGVDELFVPATGEFYQWSADGWRRSARDRFDPLGCDC